MIDSSSPLQTDGSKGKGIFRLVIICSAVISGILIFLSSQQLLPEAPDNWTNDWRTLLFSEHAPEQRNDIVVLLITEDTLADYPFRSPVDRGLLANLIKTLDEAKPSVIGLDFIFDRKTYEDKDNSLTSVLRKTQTPIVLGAIDQRSHNVKEANFRFQDQFLEETRRPVGHLYFARRSNMLAFGDEAIRAIAPASPPPKKWKSFAEEIVSQVKAPPIVTYPTISWLLPPKNASAETFATFRVPSHKPVEGADSEGVIPESWRQAFKNKIVLVGGEFVDRDRHLTPLSVMDRKRKPGVLIHAQIVAQLLDGRSILTTPKWSEAIIVFLLTAFGFYLGYRWNFKRYDLLVSLIGVIVLAAAGVFFFRNFHLLIPPTTLFLAWVIGVTSGHYSNLAFRAFRIG